MVYLVGIAGFIGGFVLGLMLLNRLLRGVSSEDLMKDKALRWKYGVLNWAIAILGAVCTTWAYNHYF